MLGNLLVDLNFILGDLIGGGVGNLLDSYYVSDLISLDYS